QTLCTDVQEAPVRGREYADRSLRAFLHRTAGRRGDHSGRGDSPPRPRRRHAGGPIYVPSQEPSRTDRGYGRRTVCRVASPNRATDHTVTNRTSAGPETRSCGEDTPRDR